jgi:hypothetical protein
MVAEFNVPKLESNIDKVPVPVSTGLELAALPAVEVRL